MRPTRRRPEDDRERAALEEQVRRLQLALDALYARQALLEAVVNALPTWISVKDRAGRYLLVNDALVRSHGAQPADFLGKTTEHVPELTPGGLALMVALDRQVLSGGSTVERPRYTVRLPDGRQRVRHLTKLPLRDETGDVIGVVGWSEDITAQVLADDALEANRKLLRAVIDVVPHPVSYVDAECRLQMVNPAWCALTGCTSEQVLGKTIREVETLPAPVREQLYADNLALLRTGGTPAPREYGIPVPNGEEQVHIVAKAPVRDAQGHIEGIVTVAVDITDLRRAEARAELAHARLADAVESLPAAFYLYDQDERLVVANSNATRYYPAEAKVLRPGATFGEIMRAGLSNLFHGAADLPARIERAFQYFRDPPEAYEQHLLDGRIMLARNRRTREGGTVAIRFDITEQKRVQAQLEQRERQNLSDLTLAAELQRSILRLPEAPPFLALAYRFQPSARVSGDLFHARLHSGGVYHLFVGDATGHGVAAALLTMLVRAALNGLPDGVTPDEALERLNRQLLAYDIDGRFVTGIYVSIAPDGRCLLAHAGHPFAYLLPPAGPARRPGEGGYPLGWFDSAPYPAEERRLVPGETLLLHTDGLSEWSDEAGGQFGEAALPRYVERLRAGTVEALAQGLLEGAMAHAAGRPADDDVSLFAIRYQGAP